jgi:DNA helicase-2/ATP-dependent DNA helicase PcrA
MMQNNNEHVFDSLYKKLNPGQKLAVDSVEGPVMVIAGPGTGKTSILTLRIANILRLTDTPPHGILAITYTSAGVKAIQKKLQEIIGSRAHEVAVHTFHSFALAIIGEYYDHFLHLDGFKNITDIEQESLIRSIIIDPRFAEIRPSGKPDAYVSAILHSIDSAKREDLTPDDVRAYALQEIERIKSDETSISTRGASKGKLKADAEEQIAKCKRTSLFSDVYDMYEKQKMEFGYMDFNDNISELLKALRKDELLLRLIQERFLYVMVDEHQDTNDSQNQIIKLIVEFFDTPNVFIVGDEKQAIYRFQGASVENFFGLRSGWQNMKEIALNTNYRSHQSILDASFAMIENNYAGSEHANLRVRLTAGNNKNPRPVEVVTGENTLAIENYLIQELKTISAEEPHATVAIITRRNRDLERVIRLLESNSIAVSSERSVDIFHHPIGAAFFDLIDYLIDPSKNDALAKTLAVGMWGMTFEQSIHIIRALRSNGTADFEKNMLPLLHLRRKMLSDGAVGFIIHAAEESGFISLVTRDPAYIHVWRGIVALAESLAREKNIQNPAELIKAMLDYRLSAESKTVKVSVGAPDLPIQAMTAHASKGLEFDYVFMPYASQEAWIGRARGSSFVLPKKKVEGHDIQDTRRLFYVALTRAKKHAVIMSAKEESDGKEMLPLQFISELDPKSVKTISLPRFEMELFKTTAPALATAHSRLETDIQTYSSKLVGLAKEVLLDTGLSVTALNHFLECPNKFLYQSVLKLPQAPSYASEKGTAMHEAISSTWNHLDQNRLNQTNTLESPKVSIGITIEHIQEIMLAAIEEYLRTSFLSLTERVAIQKELSEDSLAVARALLTHFSAIGPIFTERWARTVFNGTYKNGSHEIDQISIAIHGKLDAIVESGDEVLVFDYKTRRGMSVAEIKGETKNSRGDYFRQLVFYKILLEAEPRWRNRKILPSLVFVSPDDKGRCPIVSVPIVQDDITEVKKQIQCLIESVWSGDIAKSRCEDRDCEWCGLMEVSRRG